MKSTALILSILAMLSVWSVSPAFACNCGKKTDAGNQVSSCGCQHHSGGGCGGGGNIVDTCGAPEQSVSSDETLEIKNTVCPVSGKPIGSMGAGVTYMYGGKTFQLCCGGCVERFKSDPEKYFQKLETIK